jgi:hypothetical protein
MNKTFKASAAFVAVVFLFGLTSPLAALAVTAPSLGVADGYAAFGKQGVTNDSNVGTTHLWGDVGADASVTNLNDATQVDGAIKTGGAVAGVETAISAAYDALDAWPSTSALDLAGTHTVQPGVYTVGATTLNGTLTLSGSGVYIFRSTSSITTSGSAVVRLINGAAPCNVFWQIPTSMTIGSGSQIVGTIITQTGLISLATNASLVGRALAVDQVTMDSNQITEPTCTASANVGGSMSSTITVIKLVVNDNGGTKTVSDFLLFVDGGPVTSGVTYDFPTNGRVFNISETKDSKYAATFSGDCTADGHLMLSPGDTRFCIITNNDIGSPVVTPPVPPLIDLVKVPSPLALPNGPGSVLYTYTLKNTGTVPVTNVTLVGDTCSPIVLASGDTNLDKKLDLNETWVHTCTTTLAATHTNNVVATGWANGISATDIASATVVVGKPIVPPLIHVVKKPSVFALAAPGGAVTYTYTVTNPGTVALSNVSIADDKCTGLPGRVAGHPGDINKNDLLETNETWSFTCKSNLTATTTNTATASGEANGLIAKDFAIATVTVAAPVPKLPNTGFTPDGKNTPWGLVTLLSVIAGSVLLYVAKKQQNT